MFDQSGYLIVNGLVMKTLLKLVVVLGMTAFSASAEQFAFQIASQSYNREGNIAVGESDAATVARLSSVKSASENKETRSIGCSVSCSTTGCTVRCSTSCSTRCSRLNSAEVTSSRLNSDESVPSEIRSIGCSTTCSTRCSTSCSTSCSSRCSR